MIELKDIVCDNDVIDFYAAHLTPTKAGIIARIIEAFVKNEKMDRDPASDGVVGSLDNQITWFWPPPIALVDEPGYQPGRFPSIEMMTRFFFSCPVSELRGFLHKETTPGEKYDTSVYTTGLRKMPQSGGSNSTRHINAYARALAHSDRIAALRVVFKKLSAKRVDKTATYPFTTDHLRAACTNKFKQRRFNANPELTAVSVEYVIVSLCDKRTASEIATLL